MYRRSLLGRCRPALSQPTTGGVANAGLAGGLRAVQGGNVVGIDPHKRTVTATVVDRRGGIVACEHFRVSGDGHRALEAWAGQFGPVERWGVEGASGWGRHTAIFLIGRGHDVRDVCPNRTPPGLIGRGSGASPTGWIPSGSRERRSRIRCCRGRSSAPGATRVPMSCMSCSGCGRASGARSTRVASI